MILTGGDGVGLGGRLFQAREHEEQLTGLVRDAGDLVE